MDVGPTRPVLLQIDLSTRPEKSVGSDEIWEIAESALTEALDMKGWKYALNEGDGAFYGRPCSLMRLESNTKKPGCLQQPQV